MSTSNKYTIKTSNGHNYVTAVHGGGLKAIGPNVALETNATSVGPNETFTMKVTVGTFGQAQFSVAFLTAGNFYLLGVDGGGIGGPNNGECPIHTDTVTASESGQFEIAIVENISPHPKVSLKTAAGYYVTAVNGGGVGGIATVPVRSNVPNDSAATPPPPQVIFIVNRI